MTHVYFLKIYLQLAYTCLQTELGLSTPVIMSTATSLFGSTAVEMLMLPLAMKKLHEHAEGGLKETRVRQSSDTKKHPVQPDGETAYHRHCQEVKQRKYFM